MWHGPTQTDDLGFLGGDQGVERGEFGGVLALFVFPEAEQICLILRSPAVEIQEVLAVDRFAEGLNLILVGISGNDGSSRERWQVPAGEFAAIDP